jgi:hypothetical protein
VLTLAGVLLLVGMVLVLIGWRRTGLTHPWHRL